MALHHVFLVSLVALALSEAAQPVDVAVLDDSKVSGQQGVILPPSVANHGYPIGKNLVARRILPGEKKLGETSDPVLTYTTTNDDDNRGHCHNSNRCVQQLNDGDIDYGDDWLINTEHEGGNIPQQAWVILDTGSSSTACPGEISIWNQNEYTDSHRECKTFDFFASDTREGFGRYDGSGNMQGGEDQVTLLESAELGKSDQARPNIEFKIDIPACVPRRFYKFNCLTRWANDGYVGIMEIKMWVGIAEKEKDKATNRLV